MKLKIRWSRLVAVVVGIFLIASALKMFNKNDYTTEATPAATEEIAPATEEIYPAYVEETSPVSISEDVFVDTDTNLMWQDNVEAKIIRMNWKGSIDYCENISSAGFDDWRLPDYDSLKALYPKRELLKNTGTGYYWSSSSDGYFSGAAWSVDFNGGHGIIEFDYNNLYVRCVRDNK